MEFVDISLSVVALTILEIVLGIDNLVFLSILSEKLPRSQQRRGRQWGLTFAWITRLLLLASAAWLVKLTQPVVTIWQWAFSLRDIFLLLGGMFLITKATQEIHNEVSDEMQELQGTHLKRVTFRRVVAQIAIMDIIFSLDSVLTAVGLTSRFWVMALAITLAILMMIYASEPVSRFISKHPTIKMLALSFLILIGMLLIADGLAYHIPRGYLYFAMAFSMGVEALNMLKRRRRKK